MLDDMQRRLSPPEVAREWGVSARKVRLWIQTGQLRAINVAVSPTGRPRYLVMRDDVTMFMQSRLMCGNL